MNLYEANQFGMSRRTGATVSLFGIIIVSVIFGVFAISHGGTFQFVARFTVAAFLLWGVISFIWSPRGFASMPVPIQWLFFIALGLFAFFF